MLAVDPEAPKTVYAATGYRLYRSTNEGITWAHLGKFCAHTVVVNPARHAVYSGGGGCGVFRSTDGGSSWQELRLIPHDATPLASDRFTGTMYVTSRQGMYKSADGGDWEAFGVHEMGVTSLSIDPWDPQSLYVVTAGGDVDRSLDGGEHWGYLDIGAAIPDYEEFGPYMEIEVAPTSSLTLYSIFEHGSIGGLPGLFKSIDGGKWMELEVPEIPFEDGRDIAIDPADPQTLYVATEGGVFKTSDGGSTWAPLPKGGPESLLDQSITSMTLSATGSVLYVGTNHTNVLSIRLKD